MIIHLLLLAQLQPSSMNLNGSQPSWWDESTKLGPAYKIVCTGAGVTCTRSTQGTVTLDIPGGGGGGGVAGAPIDGGYLTLTAGSTGSTNEKVLSGGTNINITAAGVVSVTGTVPLATSASTATALAADPSDCAANQYATTIGANGNLTCAQVAYSQLTGTPAIPTDISAAGYITKTAEASLSNEFALGTLATGLLKNTNGTGVPTIAVAGTDYDADATGVVTGGIRLTGDLGGTATSPAVVDDSHNHTGATVSALDTGDITTGTLAAARGGLGAAQPTCSAGDFLTCNGTTCSCSTPAGGGGGLTAQQVLRLSSIGGP